jgi:hypothetical protein
VFETGSPHRRRSHEAAGALAVFLVAGAAAAVNLTVEGPFYDTRDSVLAVTGGAGAYGNARSWMELKSRAAEFAFIFHLIG